MRGLLLLLIWPLLALANAGLASNEYSLIEERNSFGLKPPPAPVSQEPTVSNLQQKVYLTGITTILGTRQALLVVAPPDAKPGTQPESIILAEGQREGSIEVLRIDEKAGKVRIANAGTPLTITFQDPPPTASQGATAQTIPGTNTPGARAPAPVLPGGTNLYAGNPGGHPPIPQFPSRFARASATASSTNTTQLTAPSPLPQAGTETLTPEEQEALRRMEEQLRDQEQRRAQQPQTPPSAGTSRQYIYEQSAPVPLRPQPRFPTIPQ